MIAKGPPGKGLQASFTIRPARYVIKAPPYGFGVSYQEPSIQSRGMRGGACLYAEVPDAPACTGTNTPCTGGLAMSGQRACFESRCWVRPGPDFCATLLPSGTHVIAPGASRTDAVYLEARGRALNWRMLTCLNGYDATTMEDSFDCRDGGQNRLYRLGEAVSVP